MGIHSKAKALRVACYCSREDRMAVGPMAATEVRQPGVTRRSSRRSRMGLPCNPNNVVGAVTLLRHALAVRARRGIQSRRGGRVPERRWPSYRRAWDCGSRAHSQRPAAVASRSVRTERRLRCLATLGAPSDRLVGGQHGSISGAHTGFSITRGA